MSHEHRHDMDGQPPEPSPDRLRPVATGDAGVQAPGPARSEVTRPASPANPAAAEPLAPDREQVVADALDNLAGQIRQAAGALRHPDDEPADSGTRQHEWCDPWSIVDLVTRELSRLGITTASGPGADHAAAVRSAAQLLADLGVAAPDRQRPASPSDQAGYAGQASAGRRGSG
jgi:hypothetical protein